MEILTGMMHRTVFCMVTKQDERKVITRLTTLPDSVLTQVLKRHLFLVANFLVCTPPFPFGRICFVVLVMR